MIAFFVVLTTVLNRPDPTQVNGHGFTTTIAAVVTSHGPSGYRYHVYFYVTNQNSTAMSPHCHVSIPKIGATPDLVNPIYQGTSTKPVAVITPSNGTVIQVVPLGSVSINCQ